MKKSNWILLTAAVVLALPAFGADKPRARDLGVPFTGTPGALNAITDVAGVEVGMVSITGGKARTGVTAILPHGKTQPQQGVFAGWFSQNGNGEMTGTTWVEESGHLWGPVMITNTHSVGVVRDAVIGWSVARYKNIDLEDWWALPVVGETWDGWLNDINGFHVKPEHAFRALEDAKTGPVAEGNVGGGTGMICYEFKGGTGTSSRRIEDESGAYTVGVLVQANFGSRPQLTIAGVPIGMEIPEQRAYASSRNLQGPNADTGSIIVVIATDAPLLPHQLKRLARRATMGIARTGSVASDSSGDIFIAFSTANPDAASPAGVAALKMIPNARITPFFQATVEATEEAIVNALVAAETVTAANGHKAIALPHDRLVTALRKYNRLAPTPAAR